MSGGSLKDMMMEDWAARVAEQRMGARSPDLSGLRSARPQPQIRRLSTSCLICVVANRGCGMDLLCDAIRANVESPGGGSFPTVWIDEAYLARKYGRGKDGVGAPTRDGVANAVDDAKRDGKYAILTSHLPWPFERMSEIQMAEVHRWLQNAPLIHVSRSPLDALRSQASPVFGTLSKHALGFSSYSWRDAGKRKTNATYWAWHQRECEEGMRGVALFTSYEELILNYENEVRRVLRHLGEDEPKRIVDVRGPRRGFAAWLDRTLGVRRDLDALCRRREPVGEGWLALRNECTDAGTVGHILAQCGSEAVCANGGKEQG